MSREASLQKNLEQLRVDHARAMGTPFQYFFCPILYRDEDVRLCRGHIVPQAFRGAAPDWTVQREDVDNLFGTLFESEFEVIQERGRHSAVDAFRDKDLSKKLRPTIYADGEEIEHYKPVGPVPDQHSRIEITDGEHTIDLALKLEPSELVEQRDRDWEIGYEKDVRLGALASLLKAAHLTLFELLGYQYGRSPGGHFVARTILGDYVDANLGLDRTDQLENAEQHFAEFTSLVRPILGNTESVHGTITDRAMKLVGTVENPWGLLVSVRTGDSVHGVMLPIFEDDDAAATYCRFLEDPFPKIETRRAEHTDGQWLVSPTSTFMDWPGGSGF